MCRVGGGRCVVDLVTIVQSVESDTRDVRVGTKLTHIGSKWNKSGTFSDQFSVYNGSETDLKKLQICPIWGPI